MVRSGCCQMLKVRLRKQAAPLRRCKSTVQSYSGVAAPTTKKYTSVTFGPNNFFFCHAYDTSMMIIVTKRGITIYVVGSYFYDKKS